MRVWISKSPKPFLLIIVFGAMVTWIWWFENRQVQRSHSFVPATATLSAVHYSPRSKSADGFYYEGIIVGSGVDFKSHRLSYGNVNSDKLYSEFLAAHPVGSSLDVFVCPDDNSEVIVYKSRISRVFRVILLVGFLFVGVGTIGLVRALTSLLMSRI